jgi:hypothetical protein
MTNAPPDPIDDPGAPLDPEATAARFIGSLERWHASVIEIGLIPPVDRDAIQAARAQASAIAEAAGRGPALARAQRMMADWTLGRYQRAGFGAAYLSGWLDEPERRLEVVSLLVDAVTAYALLDLLPDETAATLVARFDVSYGGPIFRASPEESEAATTDQPAGPVATDGG